MVSVGSFADGVGFLGAIETSLTAQGRQGMRRHLRFQCGSRRLLQSGVTEPSAIGDMRRWSSEMPYIPEVAFDGDPNGVLRRERWHRR